MASSSNTKTMRRVVLGVACLFLASPLFHRIRDSFTGSSSGSVSANLSAPVASILKPIASAITRPAADLFDETIFRHSSDFRPISQVQVQPDHMKLDLNMPQSVVRAHSPGFTCIDNAYFHKGVLYLVTDDPSSYPPLDHIERRVKYLEAESDPATPPKIATVTPAQALKIFRPTANVQQGLSVIWRDWFVGHFAHFVMEAWLGTWKVYATAIDPEGKGGLEMPRRLIQTLQDPMAWRDKFSMNPWFAKSAFPNMVQEYTIDWEERARFGMTDLYQRIVYTNRRAGKHAIENHLANKFIGAVLKLPSSDNWFQPVRESVFASLPPSKLPATSKTVVTYISRQKTIRRSIIPAMHDKLVASLKSLQPDFEIHVVELENMEPHEQVHIMARTNVLIGMHGNGLAHMVWLPPKSLVIETFFPGSWARDFAIPAAGLGHQHRAIWDDKVLLDAEMDPTMKFPRGSHGDQIPVNAAPIITMVKAFAAGQPLPGHGAVIHTIP